MIVFEWIWALALLPLPGLIVLLVPAATQNQKALYVPFYQTATANQQDMQTDDPPHLLRRVCLILMWLLLTIATSRPQWTGDAIKLPETGRDLMLAVDISNSMGAKDMRLKGRQASRLDVVKHVVGEFVQQRKGDRLGLILFGSQAYLQTPLTFDRTTVRTLLQETPLGIAGNETAIGDAIGLAIKRLHERPTHSRVLILLTDGRNNTGESSPIKAAQIAAEKGIKIHTIGFGTDQLGISGRFSRGIALDDKTLSQIANVTGGIYQRARDGRELKEIYAQLDRLEPVEQEPEIYRPVKSLFYWPLGAALILSFLLAITHPLIFSWLWTAPGFKTAPRPGS